MPKEKKPVFIELTDYEKQFVKVYPTKNNPYHKPNRSIMVMPVVADALVKKGYATHEEPDGWVEAPDEEEELIENYE